MKLDLYWRKSKKVVARWKEVLDLDQMFKNNSDGSGSSRSSWGSFVASESEILTGLIFGMPGCAKSALCKEIQSVPGGLGDDRSIQSLMGDLIKGTNTEVGALGAVATETVATRD
ncbi:hypothetical protein Syun_012467 [Stephania yunnanensis]|uniref:Uncharacterized protein n=1 Tax=Stephania yunnanensis TaxID=152371 RepID=A0AAP0JZK9_9MAGN